MAGEYGSHVYLGSILYPSRWLGFGLTVLGESNDKRGEIVYSRGRRKKMKTAKEYGQMKKILVILMSIHGQPWTVIQHTDWRGKNEK